MKPPGNYSIVSFRTRRPAATSPTYRLPRESEASLTVSSGGTAMRKAARAMVIERQYNSAFMASPAPVDSVLHAIGRTPILRLRKIVPPGSADVVVKLEYFNPTGSYKDRMALAMIEGAEKRGTLRKGMRVVEYTGGSTGSSLAMVCAIKGYEFHPLSSDAFAQEKLDTMRAFGADLEIIQSDGGKVTPALFDKFKARIAELMKDPNNFWTDQFNNPDALDGYANIGHELVEQIGHVDAYVGAVGSAGMLVGVSRALKEAHLRAERSGGQAGSKTRIVALEPSTSPFLTTGKGGPHRVEGTAAGFWPPHLTNDFYDEVRVIDENDGRAMARRAAKEEGVFAGTSSGVNLVAAIALARELGPGKVVATVAVDTGLKYLAGDLYKQ